jgi:hypothetical protein
MRFKAPVFLCLLLSVAITLPLLAQGQPTAKVTGKVTDSDGAPLPGVTVTLASPAIQGSRVMVTDSNGNYNAPPVLPGEFEITFQLEGFQTVTRKVRLSANFNITVNAQLDVSSVAEEIVVTGEAVETISQNSTAAATITKQDMDNLPVTRTLNSAIALAPGVAATGPSNALTISGAQSWENLFTLNGVVLNENIRGQAFDLFIEDAIQETSVSSAGVSAEYGRFTGGVVTAITKSGGNRFEGSYRGTWTNEDWNGSNENTPEERSNTTNRIDEATLGGRIIRDHLWFFGAARDFGIEDTETTEIFGIGYNQNDTETRWEVKLTGGTASHQLQLSHIEIAEDQGNRAHGGLGSLAIVIDDGTLGSGARSLPQELDVINYNGVLTSNLFLEAQYGERAFTFEGTGGIDQSIGTGTPNWDLVNSVIHNESLFCDDTFIPECTPEKRNNEQARIKGSYFLSTESAGSHDIALGYESFTDIRAADNHQSPNDLMLWNFAASTLDEAAQTATLNLVPGATLFEHLPILEPAQESDFQTDSIFLNDRWRLNDKWSFNLGIRYDKNDSVNSSGLKVADDSAWGPRIGATYDLGADGKNVFHASYSVYVGPQANGVFNDTSVAGTPAQFGYVYLGPAMGPDFGDNLSNEELMNFAWNWLDQQCPGAVDLDNTFGPGDPFSCPLLIQIDVPGATTVLDPNLGSTTANEFSIGYQHDFGRVGNIRVDYVNRQFGDMFADQRDQETGLGFTEDGSAFDQGVTINEDSILNREYNGLHTAFNFRFMDGRLRVGGNYTLSKTDGNFDGETGGSGPVQSSFFEYPEYREQSWNLPSGNLGIDQRHRLRAWAQYDILSGDRHRLNVSWLENFWSGTPYEPIGTIDSTPYVTNPGYITPPSDGIDYFFEGRGSRTTDSVHRSDVALNYSFNVDRWEFFVQPQLRNLFDEDATVNPNTSVSTAFNNPNLTPFNPFTETAVEGVHYTLGSNFGQPTTEDAHQLVRTFAISAGIRFNP